MTTEYSTEQLFTAIWESDLETVQQILIQCPEKVNEQFDVKGFLLLPYFS